MTTYKQEEQVLHIIYTKEIPSYLSKIADMYEGKMHNRIGLNFPVEVAMKYTGKDNAILKSFNSQSIKYVIVYKKGDKETKQHELMHAKYYLDKEYKKKVDDMWEKLSNKSKKRVIEMLRRMGYKVDKVDKVDNTDNIIIDEFQAYYYTEKSNFFGKI